MVMVGCFLGSAIANQGRMGELKPFDGRWHAWEVGQVEIWLVKHSVNDVVR